MKNVSLIIRMESDLKDELTKKAKSQGKTVSQVIRELVIGYTTTNVLTDEIINLITGAIEQINQKHDYKEEV